MKYVQPQVLLVKLQANGSDIDFSPSFQECWKVIHGAFMEIIKSAEKLPRVRYSLSTTNFSDLVSVHFTLHNVVYDL